MKEGTPVSTYSSRYVTPVLLLVGLLLVGCNGEKGDEGTEDAPVTTTTQPWHHEEEFEQDPSLRAIPDQAVLKM